MKSWIRLIPFLLLTIFMAISSFAQTEIPCNNASGVCDGKNVGDSCGEGKTCVETGFASGATASTTCTCQDSGGTVQVPLLPNGATALLIAGLAGIVARNENKRRKKQG